MGGLCSIRLKLKRSSEAPFLIMGYEFDFVGQSGWPHRPSGYRPLRSLTRYRLSGRYSPSSPLEIIVQEIAATSRHHTVRYDGANIHRKSMALIFGFARWKEDIPDPLDAIDDIELFDSGALPIDQFGAESYLEDFPEYWAKVQARKTLNASKENL